MVELRLLPKGINLSCRYIDDGAVQAQHRRPTYAGVAPCI
jgi:hypothetical protein